jgi:phytoene dehydrogenase-like protein
VSAADGYCTIFEMLDGKYVDDKTRDRYANPEVFPSYLLVSLGVSRTMENEPHWLVIPAVKPLVVDEGTNWEDIMVRIHNFDPTLAPEGKTVLSILVPTWNHEYWTVLRNKNLEEYKAQKERIANEIIDALDRRYPGLRAEVEMVDVSSPATVVRFTNNWRGSFEGWLWTPRVGLSGIKNELPGLGDFYMAGHWVEPGGGLPPAMTSGRDVAQIICKKDKKRFVTTSF